MVKRPPDYSGQHVRPEPRKVTGIGWAILLVSVGVLSIATILVTGYGK